LFNFGGSTRRPGGLLGIFLAAAALILGFQSPVLAQADLAEPALPEVIDARVTSTPERARLILDLSAPTEFAIASLAEPNRIAIDVKASGLKFAAPADVAGEGVVSGYSVEMAEGGRARTLLTLGLPAQVQQAYVLEAVADQPARLVVDLILDTPENFAARVATDLAMAMAKAGEVAAPNSIVSEPEPEPEIPGIRPLIVIDPGHGGVDNGATAPNGVHEKNIVLAFAVALQRALVETGRFDVALTRADDSFLRLEERVALARQNKADLFISIHADSFQQQEISGASVYTRDERATDVLDKVLADGENEVDVIAGFAVPQMQPAVVEILVDLMRRQMRRQSFIAAQSIVRELKPSIALRPFPVRQADFFVLQAPDVPSLLLELGFLSNASDIANLQESGWRDKTIGALARGITAYFDGVEKSLVAQQQ
jgi:N-acetylmuramoyl-L-alanine amidase